MSVLTKNKKVASGIGVAAVAAAALALGAGTYAAFTDTETAPGTTLAAGNLDLTVGSSATAQGTTIDNLRPGSVVTITYTVDNIGSVDGTLSGSFALSGSDVSCAESERENTTIDPACDSASELPGIVQGRFNGQTFRLADSANQATDLGPLTAAPGPTTISIDIIVPDSAGNEIQTDNLTMTTTFTLTQS